MKNINNGLIVYLFVALFIIIVLYQSGVFSERSSHSGANNCDVFVGIWVKYLDYQNIMVQTRLTITKVDKNKYEVQCNGSCSGSLMEYECQNGVLQTNMTFMGSNFIKRFTFNQAKGVIIDEGGSEFVRPVN
jgi:hypothetical protein